MQFAAQVTPEIQSCRIPGATDLLRPVSDIRRKPWQLIVTYKPTFPALRVEGQRERRVATPSIDSRLVASLAHEINNPLSALSAVLFLIEREATFTAQGRQHLSMARDEVERISQIARAALHHACEAAPQCADVSSLLRSVVDFYRPRFEAKGICVSARYCRESDLIVFAAPLRQAFSNLLLNAADAMPKGGRLYARISAMHEWAGQHRRGLRVTFADNGSGIPVDKLPRVLDPFFTTKGAEGSGLGLPLVKEVVQKHRGVLSVRTSTKPERSGSVFVIFLPADA